MDTFVRIARHQNFMAAANELGLSPAMVTRRLQQLEGALGVRLVSRSTRRLSLTAAGRIYFDFCLRILKEIRDQEAALKELQRAPQGHLSVVVPVSFGTMVMGKAVADFMTQFPKIKVTLIISDQWRSTFDPGDYGADLLIRFTRPRTSSLYSRRIGRMGWVICAAPSYLKTAGVPSSPRDLVNHSCLVTNRPFGSGEWKFSGPAGTQKVKVSGIVAPNAALAMRYLVTDGAGIAVLPRFCVARDLKANTLLEIMTDYKAPDQSIYAYYPHAKQQPLAMRLFLRFLKARFEATDWSEDV
jgi:DNA-binding transcriptional LysR family regulator